MLRAEEEGIRERNGGQHHRCNEHELRQTPRDGEEQGSPACCTPWGRTMLDMIG